MSNALARPQEVICAFLECGRVQAELYLNGFPILYASYTRPITAQSVHPFLIDGLNTFELLVEPGKTPSIAREQYETSVDAEGYARAWLGGYAENAPIFPDQGRRVADIVFHRNHEPNDLKFPASFYTSFDLGHWRGPLAWQDAPALRLDEEMRQAAFATLRELVQIHQNGDLDAICDIFGPHIRDFTRIFGWTEADLRARFQEMLIGYADDPDAILPWNEADTDFRLVAHGRLIECINKDWLPTLRMRTPTGQILKKAVYLGLDGGKLRVFR